MIDCISQRKSITISLLMLIVLLKTNQKVRVNSITIILLKKRKKLSKSRKKRRKNHIRKVKRYRTLRNLRNDRYKKKLRKDIDNLRIRKGRTGPRNLLN